MKTIIEIQHKELNVKDTNMDKFVKEDLKSKGVKATEVETLNIYYIPDTANVCYVAVKKDGTEIKDTLNAYGIPEYPAPVKKAATKKAVAKEDKPVVKAEPKKAAKITKKAATKTTKATKK